MDEVFFINSSSETAQKVGFAVLVAHQNCSILREYGRRQWIEYNGQWTSAAELYKIIDEPQFIEQRLILPQNAFYPFSWTEDILPELLTMSLSGSRERAFDWRKTYTVHLYNTFAKDILPNDDAGALKYVMADNTNLARALKPILLAAIRENIVDLCVYDTSYCPKVKPDIILFRNKTLV